MRISGRLFLQRHKRVLFRSSFLLPKREKPTERVPVQVRECWSPELGRGYGPDYDFLRGGPDEYRLGELASKAQPHGDLLSFAVMDEKGIVQGLMECSFPEKGRGQVAEVDDLVTAPWNNTMLGHYDPSKALRGVGSVLVATAAQMGFRIQQRNIGSDLAVRVSSSDSAQSFYEKIGMRPVSDVFPEDAATASHFCFTGDMALGFLRSTLG